MLHFCITEEQNYLYCLIICQSVRSAFMFPLCCLSFLKPFLEKETATHQYLILAWEIVDG